LIVGVLLWTVKASLSNNAAATTSKLRHEEQSDGPDPLCKTCGELKALDKFWKKGRSLTGKQRYEIHCGACLNAKRSQKYHSDAGYRARQKAKSRRYYWNHLEERRAAGRAYAHSQRGRQTNRTAVERYRERHPKKVAAHTAVYIATRNGKLNRPEACSRCGVVSSIVHGHHPDYDRPLEVIWFCRRCHDEHHWPIPTDLVGGNA
jgi:hypothetical protein